MGFPRIFKTPEYNRFEYRPIYYDEKKEALEEKKKYYAQLKASKEKGEYIPNLKGKFKSNMKRSSFAQESKISNLRIFVIIMVFGVLTYYLLQKWDLISYMFNILIQK